MSSSSSIERHSTSTAGSAAPLCENSEAELSPQEQVEFQVALWELLEQRVRLYTGAESSSVPELTAHQLLLSICFTLGIDSENPSPFIVRQIMSEGISERFKTNLSKLDLKTKRSSVLLHEANLCTPFLGSIALEDTLKSIQKVVEVYDYRYFAHEVPAEIDYPLAMPVSETQQGIDYINKYLERLIIEGTFLQNFDSRSCKQLLAAIHEEYRFLLINLFEPIATNAIGLTIAGKDSFGLHITPDDLSAIEETFKACDKKASIEILTQAAKHLCEQTCLSGKEPYSYIEKVAASLFARIKNSIKHGSLGGVFVSLKQQVD